MNGVDIVMSTFSRLSMQMESKIIFLSNLKWIVVDEVDTLF